LYEKEREIRNGMGRDRKEKKKQTKELKEKTRKQGKRLVEGGYEAEEEDKKIKERLDRLDSKIT
jgi:hypothetical protein